MPSYPTYPSQPNRGCVPATLGPVEWRASSTTAPYYQRRFDAMYGRHLAGYGEIERAPDVVDNRPARNEIEVLNDLDDSAGAGILNPHGTPPNIYPDSGIFSNNRALPGYVKRDPLYYPSEVKDITTGREVTYVNAGAVAMDDRAKVAFMENSWLSPPASVIDWLRTSRVMDESTANVRQNPVPITEQANAQPQAGLGALPPVVNFALAAGGLGLVAGLIYGLVRSQ